MAKEGSRLFFCSSLGHCVDHMGKQDEAVTGTLCVVDLDARLCNGSPQRSILAFLKGYFMREMAFFFSRFKHGEAGRGRNICGWAGC